MLKSTFWLVQLRPMTHDLMKDSLALLGFRVRLTFSLSRHDISTINCPRVDLVVARVPVPTAALMRCSARPNSVCLLLCCRSLLCRPSCSLLLLRQVTKVCVTELRNRTYHARIHYAAATGSGGGASGGEIDIDARPSDAINLGMRFGAPIYVARKVRPPSILGS